MGLMKHLVDRRRSSSPSSEGEEEVKIPSSGFGVSSSSLPKPRTCCFSNPFLPNTHDDRDDLIMPDYDHVLYLIYVCPPLLSSSPNRA